MLNCTDLACILHHHHYYAHLHHLRHQLQNGLGENDDVGDGLQNLLNDTDSEQSSHLDAPSDTMYMVCGVVIAMLLVGLIIVLLAVTISKLRKREEHSNSVHPEAAPQTHPAVVPPAVEPVAYRQQPLWVFPPNPPQPFLYCSNQDSLSQNLSRSGSFRKNLGGRWKRFVKGKSPQDPHAIPPELKPQLKTIYVY